MLRLSQTSTSQCSYVTLLLIGINNAGKTTVLNSLKGDLHSETVPTYGFSSADIPAAKCNFKVYDLGGGRSIRRIWTIYVSEVHGIIYVVDAADPVRFEEARTAFHQLLDAPQLAGKPVLVLANKHDLPNVQPLSTVAEALGLGQLQTDRNAHHILPCTARAAGQQQPDPALQQGLQWLIDAINPVYAQLQAKITKESAEAKSAEELRRRDREERAKRSKLERLEREKQQEPWPQQGLVEQQRPGQLHVSAQQQEGLLRKAGLNEKIYGVAGACNSTSSIGQDSCSSASCTHTTCSTSCGEAATYTAAGAAAVIGQPQVAHEASGSGAFSRFDAQILGSTADECCTARSALGPSAALTVSSTSPAAAETCNVVTINSLDKQGSVVSSPGAEAAIITSNNISDKRAGTMSPSMQAPGPGRQLLCLLMQALPGSVPAGTPTAFSDLKQAALDECGPTPRAFSISSDASSLFLSEPQRQHRPGAQPPAHSYKSCHVAAREASADHVAHGSAESRTEAGLQKAARSTALPVQKAVDALGGGCLTIANRSALKGKYGQTNRVQPV